MSEVLLNKPDTQAIEAKHMSSDDMTGLGRRAVELGIKSAGYAAEDDEMMVDVFEPYRQENLRSAREELAGLSDKQRKLINRLVSDQPASAWLDRTLGVNQRRNTKNYVGQLLAKDKNGNYAVGEETFQNFLEWHNHALAEKQHELDGRSENLKDDFRRSFETAVADSWIPDSAQDHLKRLNDTQLVVDDGLNTTVRGSRGNAIGTSGSHEYFVRIAPEDAKSPRRVLLHELTHVTEGHDKLNPNEGGYYRPQRSRALHRVFGEGDGGLAMNEAIVEHLASSMQNGKVDVIDPASRARKKAAYAQERALLDVLANKGQQKINVRDFLAAHFEDDTQADKAGEHSAQQRLVDQLHQAFPFTDVVREVSEFKGDRNELYNYTEKLRKQAKIYKLKKNLGISALGSKFKR